MLVVCNGVYKSGSTWIFLMLLELFDQDEVPEHWRDQNQARNIDLLSEPMEILAASSSQDIALKTHSFEADFLRWVRANGGRVIVTERPLVDLLASHFHHFSSEKFRLPLFVYVLSVGFAKALEVIVYQEVATSGECKDLVVKFEELMNDPESVLLKVVRSFGMRYKPEQVSEAAKAANMRGRSYGDSFVGMDGREWFFRRQEAALSAREKFALERCVHVAQLLTSSALVRKFVRFLIMVLDPRRARFANAGGMEN